MKVTRSTLNYCSFHIFVVVVVLFTFSLLLDFSISQIVIIILISNLKQDVESNDTCQIFVRTGGPFFFCLLLYSFEASTVVSMSAVLSLSFW